MAVNLFPAKERFDIMKKIKLTWAGIIGVIAAALTAFFCCTWAIAKNRKGENFLDSGFKILIITVIAALFLAGLYALFGDVIMPTLTTKVKDLFNYNG
jgi:NhaP-type Na+/H+ or K+/H+ antiporter